MNFNFIPYSNDQRKQYINAEHIYAIYLDKLKNYQQEFRYSLFWEKERLVKKHSRTNKKEYIGKKDDNTIKIYEEFHKNKEQAKIELSNTKDKLQQAQKFNKFYKINRTPSALIKIFQKINEYSLEDKILVIGTNSLYAFESYCGIFVEEEHLATFDIDLLSKKDKKLSFLFKELLPDNKISDFLHLIDKSFKVDSKVPYRFINKDNVIIDLINPSSTNIKMDSFYNNKFFDAISLDMNGMQWLENSKLFQSLIIGEDGKVAYIKTISPLDFAIYKQWLSKQKDREPIKRNRDIEQSRLVIKLIQEYMLDINLDDILTQTKHFNKKVVEDFIGTLEV